MARTLRCPSASSFSVSSFLSTNNGPSEPKTKCNWETRAAQRIRTQPGSVEMHMQKASKNITNARSSYTYYSYMSIPEYMWPYAVSRLSRTQLRSTTRARCLAFSPKAHLTSLDTTHHPNITPWFVPKTLTQPNIASMRQIAQTNQPSFRRSETQLHLQAQNLRAPTTAACLRVAFRQFSQRAAPCVIHTQPHTADFAICLLEISASPWGKFYSSKTALDMARCQKLKSLHDTTTTILLTCRHGAIRTVLYGHVVERRVVERVLVRIQLHSQPPACRIRA